MTAKELIEALQTLDPETMIFTKGYEGGLEDAIFDGKIIHVTLNVNYEWYYGPHEKADEEVDGKTVKGISLGRD